MVLLVAGGGNASSLSVSDALAASVGGSVPSDGAAGAVTTSGGSSTIRGSMS